MVKIELQWKEFNVSLPKVEVWFRANAGGSYTGNQAANILELWFTDQPDQEILDAISAYWDGLESDDDEATSYYPASELVASVLAARSDAATKAWDALSVPQKKLISGATLLESDNAALIAAFPA